MSAILSNLELLELKLHFMNSVKDSAAKIEVLLLRSDAQKNQEAHKLALQNIYHITYPLRGTARVFHFDAVALTCHKLDDYITDLLNHNKIISREELTKITKHIEFLVSYADEFISKKEIDDQEYQTRFQKIFFHTVDQPESTKRIVLSNVKIQVLILRIPKETTKQVLTSFAEMNCHISYATDTSEAFSRLSHEKFDLIIAEYNMKPINGLSFCLAVKNEWHEKAPKVILLSDEAVKSDHSKAYTPDEIIIKSSQLSMQLDKFLEKEFSLFQKEKAPLPIKKQTKQFVKNIFFVEDDGNIIDLFTAVFEQKEDLVLFNEVTKKDPFERILQLTPNLIMSDIQVPHVDTLALLKRIKAHDDLRNTPVIFFSGDPEQPLAKELMKHGALAVLDKNIIITSLFEELERLGFEFPN